MFKLLLQHGGRQRDTEVLLCFGRFTITNKAHDFDIKGYSPIYPVQQFLFGSLLSNFKKPLRPNIHHSCHLSMPGQKIRMIGKHSWSRVSLTLESERCFPGKRPGLPWEGCERLHLTTRCRSFAICTFGRRSCCVTCSEPQRQKKKKMEQRRTMSLCGVKQKNCGIQSEKAPPIKLVKHAMV